MHHLRSKLLSDPNFNNSLLESSIDGIIVIDDRGLMIYANPIIQKLFGYDPNDLIGHNIKMLMTQTDEIKHDQYIKNHIETGHNKIIGVGREVIGRRQNGEEFPFRLAVSKFYYDEQLFFTGIVHDLSKQKIAEYELIQLNKNLETEINKRTLELQEVIVKLDKANAVLSSEINRRKNTELKLKQNEKSLLIALEKERDIHQLKSRFVSIASHEFRTPLANILSSISLINQYNELKSVDKQKPHIAKIKKNIQYLSGILNEFLDLTKIEEGKFEIYAEHFNLVEFITEIIDDLSLTKKQGQMIQLELQQGIPYDQFDIYSDKNCIKRIFDNLLTNAIKYSKDESQIQVLIKKIDLQFIIEIMDNGIGIPENELKYIFDIFYRSSNVLNIQGTGLGLNIVKKYLDEIGGSIEIFSKEKQGTTVRIKI